MRYTGINHLALVTGNMDQTVRFWRDLLGMRLVAGLGRPGYRQYFLEVSKSDLVAFFEWDGAGPVEEKEHGRPVRGSIGFDHVSFGVEAEGDLWDLKDRLNAADIWVSEVIDHGFIHSIYTFDPNGIAIEFSAVVEHVDIRAHPRVVDKNPPPAAAEGSEPRERNWPSVSSPTHPEERVLYPGDGRQLVREEENARLEKEKE